jgi:hypothetical protein
MIQDRGHFMSNPSYRAVLLALAVLLLPAAGLAGCSTGNGVSQEREAGTLHMASLDDMPAEVQKAPVAVQQGYQFAVANPELLQQIPCYCGCGAVGHTSNYACYVKEVGEDGAITFDSHSLGCSICVDITQDVMRMVREGKPAPEIRAAIDATYAQYGPSNISD